MHTGATRAPVIAGLVAVILAPTRCVRFCFSGAWRTLDPCHQRRDDAA